ncbi:MAG: twin-arginine translocation signal domain-containing protein [Chloroflexi bacterium]|nr:twin-arginine translocation signal domain-containing protein [Chloroflexota bacterium]
MAGFIQSRRGFLTQLSIGTGVGIAGGLGLHKLLATDAPATRPSETQAQASAPQVAPQASGAPGLSLDAVSLGGPMLIHIRDVANAEVAMMVGTRELIYRDPELVSRLVNTAASANTKAEG